jgi:prevent-host-death family protein
MERSIFAQDIQSLSEFRSNASGFIAQVQKTKRPLVITQNGKSAAVLLDVNEYDKLMEKIELIQDVDVALQQLGEGDGVSHSDAHQRLKSRYSE